MPNLHKHFKKGFTLVELIVTIAIIAILTAVVIPSFSTFIENGRFSNDTQRAAQLTTIIEAYAVENTLEGFDAYDIRLLINERLGENYDFTPESRHTSFFYMLESQRIIIAKYDEIEAVDQLRIVQNELLNNHSMDNPVVLNSPNALFGDDRLILSESGSAIADVVTLVNQMAHFGHSIQTQYDALVERVNNYDTGLINTLFGFGVSEKILDKIQLLLAEYNPRENIFVNNVGWYTSATSEDTIKRVVFTPGIGNIPKYNAAQDLEINVTSLTLPMTVKTVLNDAFQSSIFPNLEDVVIKTDQAPAIEASAFPVGVTMSGNDMITSEITLIDYSTYVTISLDEDTGLVTYDLDDLPIRNSVTGYKFSVKGEVVTVMIYTDAGLVGFATNAYTMTFYLNEDAVFYYFKTQTAQSTFIAPPVPVISTGTFAGWQYYDEATSTLFDIANGDALPTNDKTIDFYATWNDE